MTLEILICTIDEGIHRVEQELLPPMPGVCYLVSWQQTDAALWGDVPQALRRPDVRVVKLHGRGLSVNRNNAIANATGDVCLIADDDLRFIPEGLMQIVSKFEQDVELAIATFRFESQSDKRFYPSEEFDLRRFPKNYNVTSFEIAFRRVALQGVLPFDEHFGIGAPVLAAGEENVWLHDALALGMKGRFFPVTIVRHNHLTTGFRDACKRGVVMANGAYLYVAKRHDWMMLRALLMAWRTWRKGVPMLKSIRWVFGGILYASKIRK